jgi:asparagine synthase (glutamine-hydrolysing)
MCGFTFRRSPNLFGQHGFLKHRGPDEQSYVVGTEYEIEFSRLTITGTVDGHVPVYSSDQRWLVAFNGEVFNFKQLITSHGLPFTNSDTKVIANGLQRLGIEFLAQLRGMFAGVAIDTVSNKTYFFRDPLGEKPLFLHRSEDDIVVSSEFTALLRILSRPLKINPKAVMDYFRFGYVQEPDSFDQEIISVKRGVVLELSGDSKLKEILHLDGYDDSETDLSLCDLLDGINREVTFSTVPTGLALSAGVDSTSLLYAMSKHRESEFVPIIVNISSGEVSQEALEAIESCKRLGIEPRLIHLSDSSDLVSRLISLSAANDQPHADPSGLSYLSIFQVAKSVGIKVVLLGHGPDELFWGYSWFNERLLNSQESPIRRRSKLPAYWDTPGKNTRLLWSLGYKEEPNLADFAADRYLQSENIWERYRAELVHGYLSPNGLRQTDRLAMASGVEPRTPYADARLYGWAQRNSIKTKDAFDKREFRDSVDLGPLTSSRNRKKEGFASPMGSWFQNPDVSELSRSSLTEVSALDLDWRFTPRFHLLSPSEKYRITMLGSWLCQIKHL